MLVTCFLAKSAQRRRLHLALDDRFPSHPAVACQPAVLQADLAFGVADIVYEYMACNITLMLLGPTYAFRLWCIWVLFTLFAFYESAIVCSF